VTKRVDANSVNLFQALTRGAHFSEVDVLVRRAGGAPGKQSKPAVEYKMKLVYLTHITTTTVGGSLIEHITGALGALQIEVTPQNADGSQGQTTTGSWSQVTNSPSTTLPPGFKSRRHATRR
jgi:type VI protein secretion system component Hcp